jgi:glycosyltransferase involved in cell wall biosynthesis
VDLNRFKKGKSSRETRFAQGLKTNHQLLALISHVRANRGHMTALESFEKICPDLPDARLVFLGESDKGYRKFLIEEVQRRKLGEKVHFILDNSFDWVKLLDMVDIAMVLAVGSEGSARAVLEAMALEKPVIGANVGAIPEIVQNETSGLIVPADDPTALAEAMHRILTKPESIKKMGEAGRRIIESSFANEQRAERMEKLYLGLLNQE